MATSARVVLVTAPGGRRAHALAAGLVEQGLVACVNVVGGVVSHYRWRGRRVRDRESLLVIKTRTARLKGLEDWLKRHHPYSLPEMIVLPVVAGSKDYLRWVAEQTPLPPRHRPKLVLASSSPRRRAILRAAGIRFRVDPSNTDESSSEKDPRRLVVALARKKALEVASRHPDLPVLGADTVVVCSGTILGKPANLADAVRMITLQSGRWQRVYTGTALVVGPRVYTDLAVSRVKARKLDPERLRRLAGKHMDKAGAYAVQDRKDPLVERIVGDRDNVVGLPMRSVRRLLRRAERALRAR